MNNVYFWVFPVFVLQYVPFLKIITATIDLKTWDLLILLKINTYCSAMKEKIVCSYKPNVKGFDRKFICFIF